MDRRQFTKSLAAASFVAAAPNVLGSTARAQSQVTLKVAHFWPPIATPHQKLLLPWTERLTAESGGRLQFQLLPAMQIGGTPPQLIDHVKDGVADIVWTMPGYTTGRFPIVEAFELPLLASAAEPTSRALWEFYSSVPELQASFEGVRPLAFHTTDKYVIHTARRQIRTLSDFRGLKMRAPTRQTNKALAAVGATPVSMPLSAVPDAISKGTIDGCILPWEGVPSVRLHEIVKYHTETPPGSRSIALGAFVIAMNQKRYQELPADLRQIIDANSGHNLSRQIGRLWDDVGAAARTMATDRGNEVYAVPMAELKTWEQRLAPLADDWVKEIGGRGFNGTQLLSQARTLIDRYTAG